MEYFINIMMWAIFIALAYILLEMIVEGVMHLIEDCGIKVKRVKRKGW